MFVNYFIDVWKPVNDTLKQILHYKKITNIMPSNLKYNAKFCILLFNLKLFYSV